MKREIHNWNSFPTCDSTGKLLTTKGAGIFSRRGVPNFKKSVLIKLRPLPISATTIYDPPNHQYNLPPKQAKIVLKSIFFEQNKHTICGHLVTPYILVIKNFMTPLFFFPKIDDPPVYLGPPSEENASPLS